MVKQRMLQQAPGQAEYGVNQILSRRQTGKMRYEAEHSAFIFLVTTQFL
jgi:hypothetical protein